MIHWAIRPRRASHRRRRGTEDKRGTEDGFTTRHGSVDGAPRERGASCSRGSEGRALRNDVCEPERGNENVAASNGDVATSSPLRVAVLRGPKPGCQLPLTLCGAIRLQLLRNYFRQCLAAVPPRCLWDPRNGHALQFNFLPLLPTRSR